jgi:PRC-barrel domain
MPTPTNPAIPVGALIAAKQVEGTPVFSRSGDELGTIDDVVIEKQSGQVAYAILSFGGFLGIGEHFHPLPWSALAYDPVKEAYVVDIDAETLKSAPSFSPGEAVPWNDPAWNQRLLDYYDVDVSQGLTP